MRGKVKGETTCGENIGSSDLSTLGSPLAFQLRQHGGIRVDKSGTWEQDLSQR